ncbi:MAG TPA: lysylphosphatidylglycerol synthase transmembrane domain-containing protein [Longilinea sp.]|nr:lysylphosphatidylglycerol synthase transmembrane domain-containing protein [Longilinea sp.]
MSSQPKSFWGQYGRWLPGFIISAAALYVVVRMTNWEELKLAFASIQVGYLVLAETIFIAAVALRGLAWKILLNGKASVKQTFFVINIGYLLNNILPFRVGELARAVFLGKDTGLGMVNVLSTIVIERSFDLAISASFVLTTLPLVLGLSWAGIAAWITLGLVCLGLFTLYLVARNYAIVEGWFERWGNHSSFINKYILPQVRNFLNGLSVLTRPSQFILSLLLLVVTWLMTAGEYYIVMRCFVPQAIYWWPIFTVGILALGIALPSAPAALGLWEGAMVVALSLLGVSESVALAYAILMHFLHFTLNGLLGLYGLFREGRSFSSIMADLGIR